MWLARDENEELELYLSKPHKVKCIGGLSEYWVTSKSDIKNGCPSMSLPKGMFSDVTFENSPVEVNLVYSELNPPAYSIDEPGSDY